MKKTCILVLIIMITAAMVLACANTGTSTATTAGSSAATTQKASTAASTTAKRVGTTPFEKTTEFTILMPSWQTEANNKMHQQWATRMNAKLTFITAPTTAYEEKVSATLASGILPDIVSFAQSKALAKWIQQEAVIPLDTLLKQYGQDYLGWITAKNELYIPTYAGKQYTYVQLNQFPYMSTITIRKDWLTALGLAEPKTMADWLTVWQAFRDKDPNGNGQKDEIPVDGAFRTVFMSGYGIESHNNFTYNVAGKLVPIYEHDYYQECLAAMVSAYAKGLIDAEYLVRDDTTSKQLIITSKVGTSSRPGNECASFTTSIRETVPKAVFGSVAPPVGVHNTKPIIVGRAPVADGGVAITRSAKEPDKCVQLINYLYTDAGYLLTNFGVEGETFTLVDGKPKIKNEFATWTALRTWGMNPISLAHSWNGEQFLQITLAGKTLKELNEIELLAYHGYFDSADYAYFTLPTSIFNTATNTEKGTDIWTELKDMENKVIMGLEKVDKFNALLAELKKSGLDKITSEVQANFAQLKK